MKAVDNMGATSVTGLSAFFVTCYPQSSSSDIKRQRCRYVAVYYSENYLSNIPTALITIAF